MKHLFNSLSRPLALAMLFYLLLPGLQAQPHQKPVKPATVIDKETTGSGHYLYFKIKAGSPIQLTDYKKGQNELSPLLRGLDQVKSIESIHRPFAILKSDFLARTYRIKFLSKEDETILISSLKKLDFIEFTAADVAMESFTNDLYYDKQWSLKKINTTGAWGVASGSSSVKIAVVDDAFKMNHEDLAPSIWTNSGEIPGNGIDDDANGYIDDVNGWDAADVDNNPELSSGLPHYTFFLHGTMCASIAVAPTNNYKGIASPGNGCSFIPVKIKADASYASNGYTFSDAFDGVTYAIAAGADVVSMSWGGSLSPTADAGMISIQQAIIDAGHSNGCVFVAAAGNDKNMYYNASFGNLIYPASLNHVISVGSTDENDHISEFSNYGNATDLMAPGEYMFVAKGLTTNDYTFGSGTSFSCPLVASVCALMKSNNPSLTPTTLETCLKNGAFNIDGYNPGYAGNLGAGRLDAYFAVTCAINNKADFVILESQRVCAGDLAVFQVIIDDPAFRYFWDFGDGATLSNLTGQLVSHTYSTPGIYSVNLTVKDAGGTILFTGSREEYVMVTTCNPISNENTNWYFGDNAGLDFSSGKAVKHFNNTINFDYGSACISDPSTGNILFYGGNDMYGYRTNDATHNAINSGGSYLQGNGRPGGLMLKKPGASTTYTLFLPQSYGATFGFYLYEMTAGGSNTTLTPVAIPGPGGAAADGNGAVMISDMITAVESCAPGEFWIIVMSANGVSGVGEDLYVYKYNSSGISLINTFTLPPDLIAVSNIKAAPDGSRLAFCYLDGVNFKPTTHVFNFNKTSGGISDLVILNNGGTSLSFSPNSELLYVAGMEETISAAFMVGSIIQYNLQHPDPNISRQVIVASTNLDVRGIQLGPDDMLYINYANRKQLSAIFFPDNVKTSASPNACGYADLGTMLVNTLSQPITSGAGLPNDVDATGNAFSFHAILKNCNQVEVSTPSCGGYFWDFDDGTTSTLQNPPLHSYAPGSYTIAATLGGITGYRSVTIPNAPVATISIDPDCDRTHGIILNASPTGSQYTYTWYKNGVAIPDFTGSKYYVSADGNYSVKVTDIYIGCENTSVDYVYNSSAVFDIAMASPYTFDGFNSVDLDAGANSYPSYSSYTWYRDGELISSCNCPVITVNKAGTYVAVATGPCGTVTDEFILKLGPFCGAIEQTGPMYPGGYIIHPSTTFSSPFGFTMAGIANIIQGDLYVQSGSHLVIQNTNMIMDPCTKIIVEPGGELYIDNVNFSGCYGWEGIIVQGNSGIANLGYGTPNTLNGRVYISNSYITDAEIGVLSMNNGYFDIQNTEFDHNEFHVVADNGGAANYGLLQNNTFKRLSSLGCSHSYFTNPFPGNQYGVLINLTDQIDLVNNNFKRNALASLLSPVSRPLQSMYDVYGIGLYQSSAISISGNGFYTENAQAVYANNIASLTVTGNTFDGDGYYMNGLYAENQTELTATGNSISECFNGFEYYGAGAPYSTIENNLFDANKYGIIAAPESNPFYSTFPLNSLSSPINLNISCNKFYYNMAGIVGSGYLQDQGSPSQDASNMFTGNTEWNMMWQNPMPINYYYGYYTDPHAYSILTSYLMNGVIQSVPDINSMMFSGGSSCYGSWKKDPSTGIKKETASSVQVYPNPFSDRLEIVLGGSGTEEMSIQITDAQGRNVYTGSSRGGEKHVEINLPEWAPGVYILTITGSGKTEQFKLIKTSNR